MKIFVSGATGYIGHALAVELARRGNIVHALVRDPFSLYVPKHKNIRIFKGCIRDRPSIKDAMAQCDAVFHTAALVKMYSKNPADFYDINVEGTLNILEEAVNANVKKFIFTSTCGVLGASMCDPISENDIPATGIDNDYDSSKLFAENLVKDYSFKRKLSTVIVSLSKVYGPGRNTHQVSVNKAIQNFIAGKVTFIPKPGNLVSNYSYITDVIAGHILAMENGISGEQYILGGENISNLEFFQRLRIASGSKAMIVALPEYFVNAMVTLQFLKDKIIGQESFATHRAVHHIFCNKAFNNIKAISQLGYTPTPITTALQQTVAYFKTTVDKPRSSGT